MRTIDWQEYPWIASEKHRFGRAGTEYDFAAKDAEKAFEDYNAAERQAKELGKEVNRRVSVLAVSTSLAARPWFSAQLWPCSDP